MAGIRVNTPVGPGWEYSLDTETWQTSPEFYSLPTGAAFVRGTVYTVFCVNIAAGLITYQSIPFGQATSDETLQDLVRRTDLRTPQYESPGAMVAADQTNGSREQAFMPWSRVAAYVAVETPPEYRRIEAVKFLEIVETNPDLASRLCAAIPCAGSGSGGGNGTAADEVTLLYLGCYDGPLASDEGVWIDIPSKMDGDQIANPLGILRPIVSFFRYIDELDTYAPDPTIFCQRAESPDYIKLSIPGPAGTTWSGKAKFENPI